jgi:hypothetical protein
MRVKGFSRGSSVGLQQQQQQQQQQYLVYRFHVYWDMQLSFVAACCVLSLPGCCAHAHIWHPAGVQATNGAPFLF